MVPRLDATELRAAMASTAAMYWQTVPLANAMLASLAAQQACSATQVPLCSAGLAMRASMAAQLA